MFMASESGRGFMHRHLLRLAIGAGAVAALAVPATTLAAGSSKAAAAATSSAQLYNSTVTVASVGSLPSVGAEAYSFNEFGNEVNLVGNHLGNVVVTLSSWGCQTGTWNGDNCGTLANATFAVPITFNIYAPPALGSNVPGAVIATRTQSFNIPYRPSANFAHCSGASAGEWWDAALHSCFNGKAVDVTFNFSGTVVHSTDVVFGIAYNTTHYGYSPMGESASCFGTSGGCGYDSLNIALTQDDGTGYGGNVTTGSDRYPGTVYQNAAFGADYCDGGTAGVNTFRIDSPGAASCWGVNSPSTAPFYIPAVDIK
jgi:hypothetical protein